MRCKRAKLAVCLLTAASMGLFAGGCGKKQEPAPVAPEGQVKEETDLDIESGPDADTVLEDTATEDDPHKGQVRSFLTGEWIDKRLAVKRPVSCMIGNTDSALPQFGIGQAQVVYEAPVEGGLTRLMGIFQDYEGLSKLGSVRSGRLYFAYYSMGFDAVYLHYGQASYAQGFLESGQIDDLNCMEHAVDAAVIYRDSTKKAPHNAYATGAGLVKGIELKQYGKEHTQDYQGTFQFAKDDEPATLSGASIQDAGAVCPGYLINKPYFEYNGQDGLYYRYQYGGRQIDGNDGNQLAVKNILIQKADIRVLDDNGYLEVATTGSGAGWYITDGKAAEVTWECPDTFSPTRYYDSNGAEITLNQGKTWVCTVDNAHPERIKFYADASQMQ